MNDQDLQLREFAEGIADLIKQVPTIRDETAAIRTGNEERKLAEEAVSVFFVGTRLVLRSILLARAEYESARPAPGDFLRTA